jgi:hypothetical protein
VSRGADFIARGNGAPRNREEPPPAARWAEAVAILVTGLSAIARLGGGEARSVAISTLNRASESVPSVMKDPSVRAAIALGAGIAETRAPAAAPMSDPRLLEELRLTRAAIDELKAIPAHAHLMSTTITTTPISATPTAVPETHPAETQAFDTAYFERRIVELEAKRKWAQERGDKPGARTASTQLTKARKRLRELSCGVVQAGAPFNPAIARPK